MIQRQRHAPLIGKRTVVSDSARPDDTDVRPDQTIPAMPLPRDVDGDEPTILGFPAEEETGTGDLSDGSHPPTEERPDEPAPESELPLRLVTVRRGDPVAGIALLLSGVAAIGSLWLPWWQDGTATGWVLARRALAVADVDVRALDGTALWEPLVIAICGGFLFLVGVMLFLPERTHRIAGLLSLLIASVATVAAVSAVADAEWSAARFGLGMWSAIAVAALGVLGALKAMLTVPRVTLRLRGRSRTG
jgi:hypothetical protein